jgi:hypothetical protein
MAGEFVKLKLRDMYAIKHALQNVVRQKRNRLEQICTEELPQNYDNDLQEEMDKLDKDIVHEEALINKFEEEIAEFRDKYRLLKTI